MGLPPDGGAPPDGADAADGADRPDLAYFPLARRLVGKGHASFGLLPVDLDTPLFPLARHLARALGELGERVALVAPWADWKALGAATAERGPGAEGDVLAVSRSRNVTEVTLVRGSSGQIPRTLEQANPHLRSEFSRVLFDLSGMDVTSEQSEAVDLVGGVVIVGRAGRTTEKTLARLRDSLSPSRVLGVILVA